MDNELVRYSRAGDAFHYRWAARRCLQMIHPSSRVSSIVIEGSKEKKAAGEYVIDVAEYAHAVGNSQKQIAYFQLKHSTKREKQPFNLSDLKDTIAGFARRFSDLFCGTDRGYRLGSVKFCLVTNRPVNVTFKNGVSALGSGATAKKRLKNTLRKYTQLGSKRLREFCASVEIIDGEGNYVAQRHELHAEISRLLASPAHDDRIDSVIALVHERALPGSNGEIVREDILKRFGVNSERDLFPAPPAFETPVCVIKREQHNFFIDKVLESSAPIMIHAGGGVGKSVVARQLAESLPDGSLAIVYDCFGSGKYRNRSEPRHRHRDALVEIINETAVHGLCEPLIPHSSDLDDALLRAFLERSRTAAAALRSKNRDAVLAFLIDAVDNAEMAAEEFSEPCFASQLLREKVPDGCRIVALCRTERIDLLKPPGSVRQFELKPFSEAETVVHLRKHFPAATEADGLEFHRLTGVGNPRVQANQLNIGYKTISDVLKSLGPSGTTVDDQIAARLDSAISAAKEGLPANYQKHIEAICLGLSNLPPFIPIKVLATAADVHVTAAKSFIADFGRYLWLTDSSVQFRDEPTETWFREKYSASEGQIATYVKTLKPLASDSSYVAEVLPSLLLRSGQYDELITLALSDDFLPDNLIDKRNIRVYRLQFAFKAALKQKRYADAVKLALRAGEEMAGDRRQVELLKENADLIPPLQSQEKVQELAFRRRLSGNWDGSENAYSAALLSSVADFRGEARGFLRAAQNWLSVFFEEREKSKDSPHEEALEDADIVELASAHFNLFGASALVHFILAWRPPEVIFRVARLFIRRLIDVGNLTAIDEISRVGNLNQHLMIAIVDELLAVGKFLPQDVLLPCLDLFTEESTRIPKPESHFSEDAISKAIVSFAEACAATGLSNAKILLVLKHYLSDRASRLVSSEYQDTEWTCPQK